MTSRGKVENMWCLSLSPQNFFMFSCATPHLAFTFLNNYCDIPTVLCAQFFYTWVIPILQDTVSCIVIPTSYCVLLSRWKLLLIRPNPIQNINTYPSLFFWGVHTSRLVFSMLYLFNFEFFHTFYFHHFVVELTDNTLSCYLHPITFVHNSASCHFTQSPATVVT